LGRKNEKERRREKALLIKKFAVSRRRERKRERERVAIRVRIIKKRAEFSTRAHGGAYKEGYVNELIT